MVLVASKSFCAISAAGVFFSLAGAQAIADDQTTHTHGFGTAQVLIEPPLVIVEISLAANDVVGFEHAPKNKAETSLIEDAVSSLGDSLQNLDVSDGGQCDPSLVDVVATQFGIPVEPNAPDSMPKADTATDSATGGEQANADATTDSDAVTIPEHTDFIAVHSFNCENAGALRSIGVNLFGAYAGLTEMKVTVTSKGATATQTLTVDDFIIELP